jgi:hypothetical protein
MKVPLPSVATTKAILVVAVGFALYARHGTKEHDWLIDGVEKIIRPTALVLVAG